MKSKIVFSLVAAISSLLIAGCCCKKHCSSQKETAAKTENTNNLVKVTVVFYKLDGCNYILQLENGEKLEPINLKDDYKKDKLSIWIAYKLRPELMSTCMAGKMVEITEVKLK